MSAAQLYVQADHRALVATDVTKSYGARRVLDGVRLVVAPGRRFGLVGENGVGKSTLLRLLAGVEEPDHGVIRRPSSIGWLPQEPSFELIDTVGDVLERALAPARRLAAEVELLAAQLASTTEARATAAAYASALHRAELASVWDADRRARLVVGGLGLGGIDDQRLLVELSAGQRARLALASLLVEQPLALLLDEPTNHLDDEAVAFLEAHLVTIPGALVVASHDRVLLDAVCTDIVDLDPARDGVARFDGLVRHGGGYTEHLQAMAAERRRWEAQYLAEQHELAALRAAVVDTARRVAPGRARRDGNKMGYHAHGARVEQQVSRRVRNARLRLSGLERAQVSEPPAPLTFSGLLSRVAPAEGLLLHAAGAVVSDRVMIDSFVVRAGEHKLLTGPNGAGKSTLLELLAGALHASAGVVRRRPGIRISMLAQDGWPGDGTRTAAETYERAVGAAVAEAVPLHSLGLLPRAELERPVRALSVGQQRRLALAIAIADPPDLLLLDEPTNHLSLALVEELEEALDSAPGAVLMASHDRWLRRRWAGIEIRMRDGRIDG